MKIIKNNQKEKVPYHLGIIMDGNRRWARENGLPNFEGHRRGSEKIKKISQYAWKRGVRILTFYAFSSENWQRSRREVDYLMKLIEKAFNKKYVSDLTEKEIKLIVLGEKRKLSKSLQKKIEEAEEKTKKGKKRVLNLAISYGGRLEIIQAVKNILKRGIKPEELDEEIISKNLWTNNLPDPDLIIRTGGEKRLSNFLTWQSVYSELYFTDRYWPDFEESDLDIAFQDYNQRKRRFGK